MRGHVSSLASGIAQWPHSCIDDPKNFLVVSRDKRLGLSQKSQQKGLNPNPNEKPGHAQWSQNRLSKKITDVRQDLH